MPHITRNVQEPYDALSLREHLAGDVLTVCACWLLTAKDGTRVGATANTSDLVLPGRAGVVFKSRRGLKPSAIDAETEGDSAGLEVEAVLDSELITEKSLRAGKWNLARFEIFLVNYKAVGMGELILHYGELGNVNIAGEQFRAQAEPLTARAKRMKLGRLVRVKCDCLRLGDARCKVDVTVPAAGDGGAITVTGTVATGGSNISFTDAVRTEADDYFKNGEVTFTSGDLTGQTFEIKAFADGVFTLHLPAVELIDAGTTYTALRGCDRTIAMCGDVYANAPNHRGYPHVKTIEQVNRIKRV
ncbi:MAG: DUF2163 domain-containing protein [Pyrinomonadaceae bacterium MAG19_C2-C3]|nr:DUF2163 domain-containing protein [Pyrinomonadaceae bacterium MAG19_C2-C3]